MNSIVLQVTERIIGRSQDSCRAYLECMAAATNDKVEPASLSCGNLAHGIAAFG
jgi:phosphogluconate dehydratase